MLLFQSLLGAVVQIAIFVGAVLGVLAWRRNRVLRSELHSVQQNVSELRRALEDAGVSLPEPPPREEEPAPAEPLQSDGSEWGEREPKEPDPAESAATEPAPGGWPEPTESPPGTSGRVVKEPGSGGGRQEIEEALTSRWLVWGGSVALAAGATSWSSSPSSRVCSVRRSASCSPWCSASC